MARERTAGQRDHRDDRRTCAFLYLLARSRRASQPRGSTVAPHEAFISLRAAARGVLTRNVRRLLTSRAS
jgi:hypothetical protein